MKLRARNHTLLKRKLQNISLKFFNSQTYKIFLYLICILGIYRDNYISGGILKLLGVTPLFYKINFNCVNRFGQLLTDFMEIEYSQVNQINFFKLIYKLQLHS